MSEQHPQPQPTPLSWRDVYTLVQEVEVRILDEFRNATTRSQADHAREHDLEEARQVTRITLEAEARNLARDAVDKSLLRLTDAMAILQTGASINSGKGIGQATVIAIIISSISAIGGLVGVMSFLLTTVGP